MKKIIRIIFLPLIIYSLNFSKVFSQTQIAIWDFASVSNASTSSFSATSDAVIGVPSIQQFNQVINNNGVAGVSYTDISSITYPASSAISWNDITGPGTDAELIISMNTTSWTAISMRFDYKSESTNSFDVEYSTDGGITWTQIINNTSLTSDGFINWSSKIVNLSSFTALNNQSNLKIKIQDLDNTGNDHFAFDNIEFYGSSSNQTPSGNPSIELYNLSTKYLNLNSTSGSASAVISDVTDPCRTKGITFLLKDANTPLSTLTLSANSSNNSVVTNTNLSFTYVNDSIRNLKITPNGVGYSTITITVSDGSATDTYLLNYAASAAAYNIPNTDFHTGISDASTGIDVGSNYFLSGDDESNALHLYHKDSSGYFFNSFDIAGPMGIPEEGDFEASCKKASKIYWMSSLGNSASGNIKVSRHRFFATTIAGTGSLTTASYMGSYDMRPSITSWGNTNGYNFTASGANGMIPKQIDGLNVEGMCLGPNDTSLFIGFRAPLVPISNRTKALICPVKNFEAWFNNGSPTVSPQYGNPIELNLGGRGIRSMEKNANGQYLIVAGSFDNVHNPALFEWDGIATSTPVLLTANLTSLNPEGIISFPSPFYNGSTVELISDDGTEIWYNDAIENKSLTEKRNKKFRTIKVPTSGGTLQPCLGASLTAVAASQTAICVGYSTVLTINGNLNGSSNWQIYSGSCGTNSVASTIGNSLTVSPSVTTTYFVRGEGGCSLPGNCSNITVSVNLCTTISQENLANIFEVYPNPATELININANGFSFYQVMIYNSVGQLQLSHYNQGPKATIYLSGLLPGVYYIKLLTEYGNIVKKIIKN